MSKLTKQTVIALNKTGKLLNPLITENRRATSTGSLQTTHAQREKSRRMSHNLTEKDRRIETYWNLRLTAEKLNTSLTNNTTTMAKLSKGTHQL